MSANRSKTGWTLVVALIAIVGFGVAPALLAAPLAPAAVGSSPGTSPPPPVDPVLTLSPSSGPSGVTVTAHWSDFSSSDEGAGVTLTVTPAGGSTTTLTTDPSFCTGSDLFSGCTFTASTATGFAFSSDGTSNTVEAIGSSGDTGTATFTGTVPSLTLSPPSGPSGVIVTATAAGFTSTDASIAVTIGSTSLCTISASGGGGSCTFTPTSSNGFAFSSGGTPNTVTATGSAVGDTATATFAGVTETLTLSPVSGPVGATVSLSGTAYTTGTTYDYCFEAAGASSACATTSDSFSTGSGTSIPTGTTIVVPSSANGEVVVSDASTSTVVATASFTVTVPTISVSPGGGARGTAYVVSGTGFSVGASVTVAFGGLGDQTPFTCSPGTSSGTTITTTGTGGSPPGAFTCSFSVPDTASHGTYYAVQATDVLSGDLSNAVSFLVGPSYGITFTETGLTGGSWQVVIDGTTLSATYPTDTITFTGLEGTAYGYSVSDTNSQTATPSFGLVSEASPSVSVSFGSAPPAPETFAVTFSETGLSAGSWTVVIDGVAYSEPSTTTTILVSGLLVGTAYGYSVSSTDGQSPSPSFGLVSATGTVDVTFGALPALPVAPLASPVGAGPAAAASGMVGALAATAFVLSVAVSVAGMLGVALVLLRTRTRIEESGNAVPTGSRRHEK